MDLYTKNGQCFVLEQKLGEGSGGVIYDIPGSKYPALVAKIFKKPNKQLQEKMEAIIQLRFPDEVRRYFVLPQVLLYQDEQCKHLVGYTMEKVEGYDTLQAVYTETNPLSTYQQAWVAANLCHAVIALHGFGKLAVGDFNAKNILVNRATGAIKFIDGDSMHFSLSVQGVSKRYPCTALAPELIIPELVRKMKDQGCVSYEKLKGETFTYATDYLCLAYHLHYLLTGQPPYRCALSSDSKAAMPSVLAMSCHGQYAYTNLPAGTRLPNTFPDFKILSPKLRHLFIKTFQYGANAPSRRATPHEFLPAIESYIQSLRLCRCNGYDHYVRKGYFGLQCPWCCVQEVKNQVRDCKNLALLTNCELKRVIKNMPWQRGEAYLTLGLRNLGVAEQAASPLQFFKKGRAFIYLQLAKHSLEKSNPAKKALLEKADFALLDCALF